MVVPASLLVIVTSYYPHHAKLQTSLINVLDKETCISKGKHLPYILWMGADITRLVPHRFPEAVSIHTVGAGRIEGSSRVYKVCLSSVRYQ